MRIFIYEYICAELDGVATPPSLRAEGRAMLEAAIADFARLPGVSVAQIPDGHADNVEAAFRTLARHSDFTLVIAPEFDDLLETRSRWVLEEGGTLLGCTPEAIRLTGDKLTLADVWQDCDVPTPPAWLYSVAVPPYPVVCKPRFGAGSQATFLARDAAELSDLVAETEWPGERIVQPFVSGMPVSAALIVGKTNTVALLPAAQVLSKDGRFQYHGGVVPLPEVLAERAARLARRAVAPIEGLRGYVGVDMILGDAPDGGRDVAIEINPRLTTSYVGLRALAESNLAAAMLAAARADPIPAPRWRPGRVLFDASGKVK